MFGCLNPPLCALTWSAWHEEKKVGDAASVWMCLLRIPRQHQSKSLAPCSVCLSPTLSLLTHLCSLSLSLSSSLTLVHSPHPCVSLLSSCRQGKPQTSWPASPSAARPASLPCRGPCQSSSASSHAALHETFHCTSANVYLLGLNQ